MSLCHLCAAPAVWLYAAPGITGGQFFCATCLPAHLKAFIGSEVTPVAAAAESVSSPIWEEAQVAPAPSAPKKRTNRAKAKTS